MPGYILLVYDGPAATEKDIIQLIQCVSDKSIKLGLNNRKEFGIHVDQEYADCFVVRPDSYVSRGKFYSHQLEEALARYNTAIGPNDTHKTKIVICHKSQEPKVMGFQGDNYERFELPAYDARPGEPRWDLFDLRWILAENALKRRTYESEARYDELAANIDQILAERLDRLGEKFDEKAAQIDREPEKRTINLEFQKLFGHTGIALRKGRGNNLEELVRKVG